MNENDTILVCARCLSLFSPDDEYWFSHNKADPPVHACYGEDDYSESVEMTHKDLEIEKLKRTGRVKKLTALLKQKLVEAKASSSQSNKNPPPTAPATLDESADGPIIYHMLQRRLYGFTIPVVDMSHAINVLKKKREFPEYANNDDRFTALIEDTAAILKSRRFNKLAKHQKKPITYDNLMDMVEMTTQSL